eukprot:scaffold19231_cov155-Skeletonema_dohrnii-CCMP3373.AAC.1
MAQWPSLLPIQPAGKNIRSRLSSQNSILEGGIVATPPATQTARIKILSSGGRARCPFPPATRKAGTTQFFKLDFKQKIFLLRHSSGCPPSL